MCPEPHSTKHIEGRADYGGGQIAHVANIVEFRDGRIWREVRYYAEPFEAPEWRAQWVERMEESPASGGPSTKAATASYRAPANEAGGALDGPRPSAKLEPEPAGRSDADLEPQVHIACRRPASNTPILQGDLVQDGEHIRWRDPEAAQVPDDSPVQPTLGVK